MVARSLKKPTKMISTWGPRGTAGLVEEWEPRITEHQVVQRRRRVDRVVEVTKNVANPKKERT